MINKILSLCLLLLICINAFSISTFADEAISTVVSAQITDINGTEQYSLQDGSTAYGITLQSGDALTITSDMPAQGIYLKWATYPQNGYSLTQGELTKEQNSGFFQEFVQIPLSAKTPITMQFNGSGKIVEMSLYSEGTLPSDVHNWQMPVEKADILLLPAHADDEHLFFGAVMPTYLNMGNVSVQVAYLVNHSTEPYRQQEMLNALWAAGLKNYPIVGPFHDQLSYSLQHAKTIYNEQEVIDYIVDLYERFEPQVVVGHDFAGEYGHGAHMLFAECMVNAPEQTEAKPQKIYVHLYSENEIVMEVDTPLENFGGRTAFEVAQDAFAHHKSQLTYFSVEKSGPYDLRKFGLAYTLVAPDLNNDMLENITTYATQAQIQAEAEAAAQAEQLAAEQAAAQKAIEESEALALSSSLAAQKAAQTNLIILLSVIFALLLIATIIIVLIISNRKSKRRKRRRKRRK